MAVASESTAELVVAVVPNWARHLSLSEQEAFEAVERRDLPSLSAAFNRGADLSARDCLHRFGRTCIHVAVAGGDSSFPILRLLSELGADVTVLDARGYSALHAACRGGQASAVSELIRLGELQFERTGGRLHRFDLNLPRVTPTPKRADAVQASGGGDDSSDASDSYVKDKSGVGWAPLHLAAMGGHSEVLRVLLERPGLDLERRSPGGETALHLAARGGHAEAVRVMLAAGASREARVGSGLSGAGAGGALPVTLAAAAGRRGALRALSGGAPSAAWVHAPADPATGASVVEVARRAGHHRLADALLEWSAGVEGSAWARAEGLRLAGERMRLEAMRRLAAVDAERMALQAKRQRLEGLLRAKRRIEALEGGGGSAATAPQLEAVKNGVGAEESKST